MSMTSNGIEGATKLCLRSRRVATGQASHAADSRYVEQFWLPILGPSTTWLIRHLNHQLDVGGEDVIVDLGEIGNALGLGERAGRHAPLLRSLRRAGDYDMVMTPQADESNDAATTRLVLVRRALPPLSPRLVERLAPNLARAHHAICAAASDERSDVVRDVASHLSRAPQVTR